MSEYKSPEHYARRLEALLDAHPEAGWIFGVCAVIARRTEWQLAYVRGTSVLLLLFFPLVTGLTYLGLAFWFPETRARTQSRLMRWARRADELVAAIARGIRNAMASGDGNSTPKA